MSRLRAIWLVAVRELIERGRSRAFLIGLVVTEAIILAVVLVPGILGLGDDPVELGHVGEPSAELRAAVDLAAQPLEIEVDLETYPDLAAGEAAVEADEVDVLIVPPAVSAGSAGAGELVVKDTPDFRAAGVAQGAFAILGQQQAPPMPSVRALDPESEVDQAAFVISQVGAILLFISIFSFGYWVLTGVIEEKQSRVVEVVLATVVPRDLLMGKVLGIGILGLVQLLAMVGTALVAVTVTGTFTLPATTGPAALMILVWFVIGYALYATMFAVLGALASRMEEASNVTTPVSLLASVGYIIGLVVVPMDPDGTIARVATFFPPSAPMIVPMRAVFGAIEPWEVIVAGVVAVSTTYALFVLGGRVYSGAVLRTGGRMRLRDAWRAAGE